MPLSPSSVQPAPELRVVDNEQQAAQAMPRFSHNRYPTEVVQMSAGQSIPEFAREWAGKLAEGVSDTLAGEREDEGGDAGREDRAGR